MGLMKEEMKRKVRERTVELKVKRKFKDGNMKVHTIVESRR